MKGEALPHVYKYRTKQPRKSIGRISPLFRPGEAGNNHEGRNESILRREPELKNYKNGSYGRQLDTKYGRIEDLQVPRDRENAFQTEVFQPYQRYERWLGETIITMYQKGMSTREIGNFLERILGHAYAPGTISNITDVLMEDIRAWQERPLQKRYAVLYLDGTYLKLRRDDVANEVVYVVIGVTEDGYREILGFYVGGQESSLGWEEVLSDIYRRGCEEVLLGIFDGPSRPGRSDESYLSES